jgi:hypothetical protein
MCLRIAVQEVEAWLLADPQTLATFLGISAAKIPHDVDSLANPKQVLINLARVSKRTEIRRDMIPEPGGQRSEGVAYVSRISRYIEDKSNGWRPDIAATASESLTRCMRALESLKSRLMSVETNPPGGG